MAFTRSKYGISNYAAFNRAKVTVYIEGKRKADDRGRHNSITYDEAYYSALFSLVLPEIPVTFVVLGSRTDVLAHARKIESEDIGNAVTVMDLDTTFIDQQEILPRNVVTFGYSWENEFWTKATCAHAFRSLAPTAADPDKFLTQLAEFVDSCAHALAKLSKIDALCKIHGEVYLPGSKPGIEFKAGKKSGVSSSSIREMRTRIPRSVAHAANCPRCQDALRKIRNAPILKMIQGHRWEHFCLHKVATLLRSATSEGHNHNSIKAAAFSSFTDKTEQLIDSQALRHYQQAIPDAIDFSLAKRA